VRRPGLLLGAALAVAALIGRAPLINRVFRSWPHRIAVAGHSMAPTLVDGDWLLVDPDAFATRPPAPGELCVAHDPRAPDRLIVKRCHVTTGASVVLVGDHPAHSSAVAPIGPIDLAGLVGRPWFRYWPIERIGPVR
jgi:signal peptidase I